MRAIRSWNWAAAIWFAGSGCVLIAALLLAPVQEDTGGHGRGRQVRLPLLGVLPETCATQLRLGIDCPGCGLTRCFMYSAHGDFASAWQSNSVGVFAFVYLLFQLPLSIAYWGCSGRLAERSRYMRGLIWCNERLLLVIGALLGLRWIWRLVSGDLL